MTGIGIEFGNQFALRAMALILPLAALLITLSMVRLRGRVSALELLAKTTLLAALFIASAEPFLSKSFQRSQGVLLLDISDSLEPEVGQRLLDRAREYRQQEFRYEILPFAGKTAPFPLSEREAGDFNALKNAWNKLDIGATDLENALVNSGMPPGGSVLLVSDGQETRGDLDRALARLQATGVKVFPLLLPAEQAQPGRFRISHIHAPLVAPAKKSVDIRVSVENTTGAEQRGRLTIRHDQKTVFEKDVSVAAGAETVFTAASDPLQEGIKQVTAVLEPHTGAPSSAQLYIAGEEREKILLISGRSEDARLLEPLFTNQSYQLLSRVTGGKTLSGALESHKYSAVILNNVPLAELPANAPTEIERYVSGGGGFIMIGGNRSFGLGGYKGTSIEDALPVTVLPPRREQKRLNVAVELVLDKSGSMKEQSKIEFTRDGAAEVIKSLKDEDYVGIVGFDEYPFHLVTIDLLANNRQKALSRLSQLYPAKSTRLLAAMQVAKRDLEAAQAGRKHMIILTDGKLPDEHNRLYYLELVREMRLSGITISTFLIGNEYSDLLTEIAEAGGGAFYRTMTASALPRLFMQDVKVNTGERTQKESERFDVRKGERIVSTDITSFPPILGYVETRKKPEAILELAAYARQEDPLLVSWRYGKGKAAAFTSDAGGRWSYYWAGWPRFYKFWTDLVDSVRPQAGEQLERFRFDLRTFVEKGALVLDLSIYSDAAPSAVSADLLNPDGETAAIAFSSLAPGHYRAAVDKPKAGKYEMRAHAGKVPVTPVAFSLSGELFGEKKGQGFAESVLESIAVKTGGSINPPVEELLNNQATVTEKIPLTNVFAALALILLCLEIARRELLAYRIKKPIVRRQL